MASGWLSAAMAARSGSQPCHCLRTCQMYPCMLYFQKYKANRPHVGRLMVGRPKQLDKRVPADLRTDCINHFLESSRTQRRCAVCGTKKRRYCKKCDV